MDRHIPGCLSHRIEETKSYGGKCPYARKWPIMAQYGRRWLMIFQNQQKWPKIIELKMTYVAKNDLMGLTPGTFRSCSKMNIFVVQKWRFFAKSAKFRKISENPAKYYKITITESRVISMNLWETMMVMFSYAPELWAVHMMHPIAGTAWKPDTLAMAILQEPSCPPPHPMLTHLFAAHS